MVMEAESGIRSVIEDEERERDEEHSARAVRLAKEDDIRRKYEGSDYEEDWDDDEKLGENYEAYITRISAAVARGENRKDQTHQLYVNEPNPRGAPPSEELPWVASDQIGPRGEEDSSSSTSRKRGVRSNVEGGSKKGRLDD
ncbi:hypothetical protein PSTG_18323 [Puccinia striiformis f. sp. tritici PST-78]|uniref:Uncharacterized protein n=1 Tax=Puccinia striiformis f. sp. tritici PST-78 TaxID=1165861 RepID=A0A0L0UMI2_9BASI|nr:hypothetical protein PSTG_18323 [Puccinia striiformis f. sp. tritici PST-78]